MADFISKIYFQEAESFLDWAYIRKVQLESLKKDYEFLYDPQGKRRKKRRILVLIDFFELLEYAVPYLNVVRDKGAKFLDDEVQKTLLKNQISRSVLMLAYFNTDPILLPFPYHSEFFDTLNSVMNLRPKDVPFSKVKKKFEETISKIDGLDGNTQIEELMKIDPKKVLPALIDSCPELLFYIIGEFRRGKELISFLFNKKNITSDIGLWKLPKNLLNQDELLEYVNNQKFINRWVKTFKAASFNLKSRRSFKKSWKNDIQSILLVEYLSQQFQDSDLRVIYVSNASVTKEALKIEKAEYFRDLTIFRLFFRYLGKNNKQPSKDIDINKLDADIESLGDFSNEGNKKIIKECKINGVHLPEMLSSQIERLIDLKLDLFGAHTVEACNVFLKPFMGDDVSLLSIRQYDTRNLGKYTIDTLEVLNNIGLYNQVLQDSIIQFKISMVYEYLGWLGASDLGRLNAKSKRLKKLFIDFTLFPFRISFSTPRLIKDVRRLQELFKYPKNPNSSEIERFYHLLYDLSRKCTVFDPKDSYWDDYIDSSDITDNALERRLVCLVLMFTLGFYEAVYESAEQLYEICEKKNIIYFVDEFRIIYIQAIIREAWVKAQKQGRNLKFRRRAALRVILKFNEWNKQTKGGITDPRILYLVAFASGIVARAPKKGQDSWPLKEFNKKYDKDWTVDLIQKAAKLLKVVEEKKLMDGKEIDYDENHLKWSIMANLAYYQAIDGNKADVADAIMLYEEIEKHMSDKELTAICLHNKGFVYSQAIELLDLGNLLHKYYEKAKYYFIESDNRRGDKLDIEKLFKMKIDEIKEIDKTEKREKRDFIRLDKDSVQLILIYDDKIKK